MSPAWRSVLGVLPISGVPWMWTECVRQVCSESTTEPEKIGAKADLQVAAPPKSTASRLPELDRQGFPVLEIAFFQNVVDMGFDRS